MQKRYSATNEICKLNKVAYFGLPYSNSIILRGFYTSGFRMAGERHFNNLRNFSLEKSKPSTFSGGSDY
jgi:hypothetical protein